MSDLEIHKGALPYSDGSGHSVKISANPVGDGCDTLRISQFSESVCIKLDEWETLRAEVDAVVRAYRTLRGEGGNG